MKYADNKMSDVQIAYIGGGSRGWAWTFMTDLSMDDSLSGTIRLYDIDEEAAKHNEIIGNHLTSRPDTKGKWEYKTTKTIEEALTGADFVVISILPGTFDEMESDVHLPERLGIYQSVGDTAGPGGIVRALRTIPMFVDIANAVKKYSPDAWVINYTNPMTLCVKTLYHTFPEIKAFGCCHEVFGTQKVLKGICEETMGLKDVDRRDIHVNVLGINHFTWFDQASYKGIDLFPVYRDYIDKHFEEGYNEPDKNWANSTFACAHRVKFDLFRRYGMIAAAGDRHLAEFMPGDEGTGNGYQLEVRPDHRCLEKRRLKEPSGQERPSGKRRRGNRAEALRRGRHPVNQGSVRTGSGCQQREHPQYLSADSEPAVYGGCGDQRGVQPGFH